VNPVTPVNPVISCFDLICIYLLVPAVKSLTTAVMQRRAVRHHLATKDTLDPRLIRGSFAQWTGQNRRIMVASAEPGGFSRRPVPEHRGACGYLPPGV